ncbi:hypothetical protein EDB80DRAFT_67197 [Ilyonectria destructans]|nr:hypothetical protein EDB80DRAFT_67197 [Ilyonectria destructans]
MTDRQTASVLMLYSAYLYLLTSGPVSLGARRGRGRGGGGRPVFQSHSTESNTTAIHASGKGIGHADAAMLTAPPFPSGVQLFHPNSSAPRIATAVTTVYSMDAVHDPQTILIPVFRIRRNLACVPFALAFRCLDNVSGRSRPTDAAASSPSRQSTAFLC